jgi:molybdate transport system regulatory protein
LTTKRKKSIQCRSRLRVLSGDLIALGPGKVDLLESIDKEGSISQAARERHLSYRRAWNMVDTMNKCFKEPLVISVTGGKGGGGAELTLAGKKVISLYREMEKKANTAILTEWKSLQKLLRRAAGGNEP